MPRVCHFLFTHRPLDGRIFYKETVSLAAAGFETIIVAPSIDGKTLGRQKEVLLDSQGEYHQCGVRFIPYRYYKYLPKFCGFRQWLTKQAALKKLMEINADLYHFHEDGLSMEVFLELGRLQPKAKIVFDFHEFFSAYYPPNCLARLRHWENKITKRADLIITVSDFISAYYRLFTSRPVITVMNCQSRAIFSPEPCRRDNYFLVCHEGRMLFDRGLEIILELACRTRDPQIKFLIIGNLPEEERSFILKQCRNNELANKFIFTGWLDYQKVAEQLRTASLGLYLNLSPNGRAGLGNKFFNYLRYHLPILSLDIPTIRPIIEKWGCGRIFDQSDIEAMVEWIEHLKRNPMVWAQFSEQSRAAFNEEYNWELMAERLIEAYWKVLTE